MGSGRFLEFGPLTLRMVFFVFAISLSVFIYSYRLKIKSYILWLLYIHLTLLSFSTSVGILNGAELSLIVEDVKPLLYFFMILPFAIFIKSNQSIKLVTNSIKFSSFIMMIIYLMLIAMIYFGLIDFKTVYHLISENSNDIMFRGSSSSEPQFFYKGFLYLNIGFIFFLLSPKKLDKYIALLLLISILLTFTRGFLLGLMLAFMYSFMVELKNKKSFFYFLIILLLIIIIFPIYMNFVGERGGSVRVRMIQIEQVIDSIGVLSLFIGHGFGIGVPIKPVHMEVAYLEIFHKQGLLGLIFWFAIIWMITKQYMTIKYKNHIVKSFFIGSIFVFMQSLTNPFINNPIGLSMVLISLISLKYIQKNEKNYKEKYE